MGQQAIEESGSRPTSTPPEAKVINAWATAATLVLSAVAEITGMVLSSGLLYVDRIGVEIWAGTMAYCLGGNVVAKARGRLPVPTTVALVGAATVAARHIHVALMALVLFVVSLLAGCGSALLASRAAQDVRDAALLVRTAESVADDLAELVP